MDSVAHTLPFQRSQMPAARSGLFLDEALDLIGCTTILGVSYGIAFTLYCLCAQSLYSQLRKPDQRRQARFNLGYISLLWFCATGVLAANARLIQLAYINHANSPGGPLGFEAEISSTTSPLSIIICSFDLTIEVLTVAIQVRQSRKQRTLLPATFPKSRWQETMVEGQS